MNSIQYEELCRLFLADQLGIAVTEVASVRVPNPTRPGLPKYKHQIDLYWETGDAVSRYLNIANAKWRRSEKVDQPEVLLLQQVKQKVGAHKAVILTNTDFTEGAKAAAQDEGLALHIVRPQLSLDSFPLKDRQAILEALAAQASQSGSPYRHQVVFRAFPFRDSYDATVDTIPDSSSVRPAQPTADSVVTNRMFSGTNRASASPVTRSVPSGGNTSAGGPSGGSSFGKGGGSRQKG